jgi:cysteine desulfurase
MLNFLSGNGICVSSGSACSSHSHGPSSTLLAFGLTVPQADSTIRISLSAENTEEDVQALCAALRRGVTTLVRRKR